MHSFLNCGVFLLHRFDLSGIYCCFKVVWCVLAKLFHDSISVENDNVIFIPNLFHFFEKFFDLWFSNSRKSQLSWSCSSFLRVRWFFLLLIFLDRVRIVFLLLSYSPGGHDYVFLFTFKSLLLLHKWEELTAEFIFRWIIFGHALYWKSVIPVTFVMYNISVLRVWASAYSTEWSHLEFLI